VSKERKRLDILRHELVPKHSILTKQETEDLLKKFSIRLVNLPRIFEDDPASIALGAIEGDVVRITRKSRSPVVESIETYRFVTKRRNS
jgi:DNA-directed RNA polymerase subunit H